MLNALVVLVFLRVDLSLQQNILPEHMTSHCGAINSAEIMEDILPAVRTLIKDNMEDLWRRYEEKLATMKDLYGVSRNAKAYCESEYASLAEIKNVQENDFIVRTIRNIDLPGVSLASRSYYVGGTDHAKEGEWIWAGSKDRMTFDNFQPPEPNNKANNEHCLSLYGPIHFSWNDDGCKHGYYSICKASASRVFKG